MKIVEKQSIWGKTNKFYIFDTETKEKVFLDYDMIGNFTIGINEAWSDNSPVNYFQLSNLDYLPLSVGIQKSKDFCDGTMSVGKFFPTGIKVRGKDVGKKKYGYIDETGRVIIPILYDEVFPFSNGRAKVILNGRTGVITKDGRFVVEINGKEIFVSGYEWAGKTYDEKGLIVSKGGKNGILNIECDIILPLEYSLHEMKPYGYLAISLRNESGLTGLIGTDGKTIVDCKYKEFGILTQWNPINDETYVYKPSEGLCIVQLTNNKYGFFDIESRKELFCIYDDVKPFSEGFACVKKNGKYGYINRLGEIVIDFVYKDAFPFEGSIARVVCCTDERENYYALINRKGELITNYKWNIIRNFHEGFAAAMDNEIENDNRWTFINEEGKPISKNRYYEVGNFNNGIAGIDFFRNTGIIIGEKQYQGVITKDGSVEKKNPLTGDHIVIPSSFQDAWFPKEGLLAIKKDGKFGFANEYFNIIIPNKFTKVESFSNGWGKVWQNKYWAFIDKKGRFFGKIQSSYYDLAIQLKQKLFIVEKNEKWGIIALNGNIILPINYNYFKPSRTNFFNYPSDFEKGNFDFIIFSNDTCHTIYCTYNDEIRAGFESVVICEDSIAVKKDGKYGFIGKDGRNITPIIYQNLKPFKNGFAALQKENKWGLIDIEGNIVLAFDYEQIFTGFYEITCIKNNIPEFFRINKGIIVKDITHRKDIFIDNEHPTYGKYAGSYAQDEMGYSDDDIDTIFDGDPDAYWNID